MLRVIIMRGSIFWGRRPGRFHHVMRAMTLRRMTFSTRSSHSVKWVWLRYIAKVLLTLRRNTFKRHCIRLMTCGGTHHVMNRPGLLPPKILPRVINVTEHAHVEEGEGLVTRLHLGTQSVWLVITYQHLFQHSIPLERHSYLPDPSPHRTCVYACAYIL